MRDHLIAAAAGAIAGCAAMLGFLAVHALTIVPIWSSVWVGVGWAIPIGAAMGAAASVVLGSPMRVRDGLVLGATVWLGLALNTGAALLVRGLWPRVPEMLEIAEAVVLALAWGGAVAASATGARRGKPVIAGALGMLAALLVVGGPVTTAARGRGGLILAGLLPVMLVFGLAQACLAQYIHARGGHDAECHHDVEIGPRHGCSSPRGRCSVRPSSASSAT